MNNIVIKVEGLSKRYHIGAKHKAYQTFREALSDAVTAPFRKVAGLLRGQATAAAGMHEIIWALKDISLQINTGEVVGIIGRNGAGKTTLLKILSRITEPTEGYAEVHGRMGTLLEVGTGFHQELTGRENVYLNGSILGMRRGEIDNKFDEIVAFAEIEKFIDAPVKFYSSGMQVRLAFSVASHLEPEILLVDEVLAVGDASFQRKCLGKMGDVAEAGRTVLFVSHNLVAIQRLCSRVIWLDEGEIVEDGQSGEVVSNYLKMYSSTQKEQKWSDMNTAPGNDSVRLRRACVHPEDGTSDDQITVRMPFLIEFEFWNLVPDSNIRINIMLITEHGITAFSSSPYQEMIWNGNPLPIGLFRSACHIPGDLLNAGLHRVMIRVVKNNRYIIYRSEDILSFDVHDSSDEQVTYFGGRAGAVRPILKWTTELLDRG